ncbi:O-antigen ligase family protein [Hydrogenimonas thermophila]|uniref:O-antigen ligase family protein n=1 Tax=Hydrogenimonas thermophila TaxID=223786 RepID=UPI0015A5CAB0|nr:O-antigen ligase family protein [Hydrogenimonas thermophila]
MAYILKGNQQRVVLSLILFLTGFLIRLFYDANILSPGPFLDYREYIFSTDKNFAAIIIDTTMVGVLLFSTYFIIDFIQKKNTVAIYNILISLVVLIPTILAWSSLNSRAAWISLAISSLFIVIILMFQTKQQGFTKKYAIVFFIFFISVISLALLVRGDMIISKLTSESKTWQAILSMDLENIPKTSIGLRIHMWHYAIQLWLQHPLLGHGLNITHLTSNIPAEMGFKGFANLHNAYLEILARTGLIGLIFYISALFITLKAVFKAYTQHYIPLFLFIFFIEILLIFLFNNVSVGFIFFQHGWQYIVLFGGIAYSYRYAQMKPEGE